MAAYRAYHRAMRIRETSKFSLVGTGYIEALEEAVALDPTFSRAWVELVIIQSFWNFAGRKPELTLAAEQSLQRIQAIAPGSADHLIGQAAYVYYALKDYDHAHDIISQALAMQPSDVRAIDMRSLIERRQGDFEAFLESRKEARRLDPRNPEWTNLVIRAQVIPHRYDEARAELENTSLESFETGNANSCFNFSKTGITNNFRILYGNCAGCIRSRFQTADGRSTLPNAITRRPWIR
jgi:tetratricopeptide (TPR) repeat protein